jgi:hypothetical protein
MATQVPTSRCLVAVTIIVLVRSTDQSERLLTIKALAPTLLALSSRFIGCRPPRGMSS